MRWRSSFVTALALALACADFEPIANRVAPGVLEVETAPGVTLEVLDWGGSGTTIVFLAGGGHTAHEFDEFAPRLTDDFRVLGITRRGIGASSLSPPAVANDGLSDIAAVLGALDLGSVVLIGHSRGGLEAAQFAAAYPERCLGIVHLDAAYLGGEAALADIFRFTPPPPPPPPSRADSASTAAMRAWIERTQGFRLPESELRAVNKLDATGRLVGRAANNTAPRGGPGGSPTLEWQTIDCPALGLYALVTPLETWLPHYAARVDSLGPEGKAQADAYVRAYSAWTAERRREFGALPQNRIVEFPGAGHYFFLENPEQDGALAAIRDFVAELPASAPTG